MDTQPEVSSQDLAEQTAKLKFLLDDDNTTAAIILIEKACEQYQTLYNKNNVPFSYINFFCEEFNKYSGLFTNKLKDFYDNFKKHNITAEDLIERYVKSFYSQHEGVNVTKEEKFLCFNEPIILTFTKEMREVTNTNVSTMVENIINICHKIDTQDELIDLTDLYERYMINEFIMANADHFIKQSNNSNATVTTVKPASDSISLVGTALEDNYESHGKITRIIIPKLNLPTAYPVDLENSRLTENKKTSRFCTPAKQIVFINRKKIIAVKYSNKFIEKRSPKPKKKFDWDF